jgi:hypothetical protein
MLNRIKKIKHKKIILLVILISFFSASYYFDILKFHSDKITYDYHKLVDTVKMKNITTKKSETKDKATEVAKINEIKVDKTTTTSDVKNKDAKPSILESTTSFISEGIDVVQDVEIIGDKIIEINYDFYNVYYNCDKASFNYIHYKPLSRYKLNKKYEDIEVYKDIVDTRVIQNCNLNKNEILELNAKKEYKHDMFAKGYGIAPNILEHNSSSERNMHFNTNIVPLHKSQVKSGGFWYYTDQLIGCLQKKNKIEVYTGNIWKDSFKYLESFQSQGISTPEHLYKIIIVDNKEVYSWIIENNNYSTVRNEREHVMKIKDIEEKIGYKLPSISNKLKNIQPSLSLGLKETCK